MIFQEHYLTGLTNWGWTGVDCFFVLSGFLITGILYDTRHTAHRFRNFYCRRVLRIFPLYYAVLLIGLLLYPIFRWVWHPAWVLWPLYLGNYARFIWLPDFVKTANVVPHLWGRMSPVENLYSSVPFQTPVILMFQHFWSLCVEEQFYLIWPPVVFLIARRSRLRNFCVAISILTLAARVVCFSSVPWIYIRMDVLYRLTPFRLDALLIGGTIALMLRGPEAQWLLRFRAVAFWAMLCGFAVLEIVYRLAAGHMYSPILFQSPWVTTVGFTLIDLFAAIVILMALDSSSWVYRVLVVKPLRRLGKISYGFYVFHQIPQALYATWVRQFYQHFGLQHGERYVYAGLGFTATLGVSILSFRFLEQPFLRMKTRFMPRGQRAVHRKTVEMSI